jgi:putative addiction module antidote
MLLLMQSLKLRKLGNSVGVVLPQKLLNSMQLKEGDTIHVTESSEQSFRVSKYDPQFASVVQRAESIMERYPNALKELAK